jgi:DNA-binding CsgD family transcriptional regulator
LNKQPTPSPAELAQFRTVVERSPIATLIFDLSDQRVRVANAAVAELIGSPTSAIVGLIPAQVWGGADGRRAKTALSALAAGALDSYRAHRQLRTSRGPVPVSVWMRRMPVVGGSLAVKIMVPSTERLAGRPGEACFGPEAVDLMLPLPGYEANSVAFVLAQTAGEPAGLNSERIAALERHLLRFAAELHAGGWRDAQPLAVDPSRFAALDDLPRRQRDIVDRLLRGERIATIADSMNITTSTVRNHLSQVYAVFGVHSQSELLVLLRTDSDAVVRAEPRDRP